ncbi:MAG: dipeptidyl-peptidase 3 family protein [Bryobacteraceae bacterium]
MKLVAILLTAMTLLAAVPDLAQLQRMAARFAPTDIAVDISKLSPADRLALEKLIEASRIVDRIFLEQMWSGNLALDAKLRKDKTPLGKARLRYFWLNKGPWSDLDEHDAFLPDVPPKKLPGANFYPPDMTKEEFEAWARKLSPDERDRAEGFFTVIRRSAHSKEGSLAMAPYSKEYQPDLGNCGKLLREAAALTGNDSLRKFLGLRAAAFESNDYYASDVAWMDLDAPLDITIGPYETYNDEIFGYKAGFEAYVNIRDEAESNKLKFFANHLQEVENHLPIDARYRNPKIGALAPIRVVNEVFAAGDGDHGVRTAAYNLPNDERVVHEKGSKRVMLKNIQEAKFRSTLEPIAARVLAPAARADLSFDSFFTHILAHELSHGIGPHRIEVSARATTPRQELKEIYSAIEEAKADITGLYMLQFFFDRGYLKPDEKRLYTTYLASSFRTLRFGLKEAHGKGMALQFNYLLDRGAFVHKGDVYEVDFAKVKDAVRDLTHDLLTVEATGDHAAAKHMLDTLGVLRPEVARTIEGLKAIPIDIEPRFVAAESVIR